MNRSRRLTLSVARLRRAAEAIMNDSAIIQRAATTYVGGGNTTESWTTIASNVSCRVTTRSLGVANRGEGLTNADTSAWQIHLPYNQAIAQGDRIVIGSFTYTVTGIMTMEPTHKVETIVNAEMVRAERGAYQ